VNRLKEVAALLPERPATALVKQLAACGTAFTDG